MFRRAAVFPVCLASGEICLYPSTCRFPPFDAKLAEKQERHVSDVSFLSLSKNYANAPVSAIIKETGVFSWKAGEKMHGMSQSS